MLRTPAYAAANAGAPLAPHQIQRREPGPEDLLIDILFCGVCHTDVSYSLGHMPGASFPLVPGHEIVGRVTKVGSAVTHHQVDDIVGVGCMVDSCRSCAECGSGHEQYCDAMVPTYSGIERGGTTPTFGGYSTRITVDQRYVLRLPKNVPLASAAPLLCAGITTYSPLRQWKVGKGSRVAIIGLGGLGHVAVKLAAAMGAHVTVLSRSDSKKADALQLGASDYEATSNAQGLARLTNRFDLILNTVSGNIDSDLYISLLKRDGALIFVGVPEQALSINAIPLMLRRKHVGGSMIGGMRETQGMLDFCGEHGIGADVEIIPIGKINDAYARIVRSDVRYRFVIDMSSLR